MTEEEMGEGRGWGGGGGGQSGVGRGVSDEDPHRGTSTRAASNSSPARSPRGPA